MYNNSTVLSYSYLWMIYKHIGLK